MKYLIRFSFLLIVVIICSTSLMAQDTQSESPQMFQLVQVEPVMDNGRSTEWNGKWLNPGAMIYHDGLYHAFPNGFKTWPGSVRIGYATSEDGINFTYHDDIVLDSQDVPYAGILAMASSVHIEDDGTWVMYFYNWIDADDGTLGAYGIGRATAPEPTGPWTPDKELVLTPGSEDAWDGLQVFIPIVLKTDEGYVMYYSGFSKDRKQAIGMASSDDGISWTKYDDPETSDAPYAESDPVLSGSTETRAWNRKIERPRVVITENGYVMIYRAAAKLGVATSTDGIHWTLQPEDPVIAATAIPTGTQLWDSAVLYVDGVIRVYIESLNVGGTKSRVFLFIHEGTIIGED